jgi:hypothetical protein
VVVMIAYDPHCIWLMRSRIWPPTDDDAPARVAPPHALTAVPSFIILWLGCNRIKNYLFLNHPQDACIILSPTTPQPTRNQREPFRLACLLLSLIAQPGSPTQSSPHSIIIVTT